MAKYEFTESFKEKVGNFLLAMLALSVVIMFIMLVFYGVGTATERI